MNERPKSLKLYWIKGIQIFATPDVAIGYDIQAVEKPTHSVHIGYHF